MFSNENPLSKTNRKFDLNFSIFHFEAQKFRKHLRLSAQISIWISHCLVCIDLQLKCMFAYNSALVSKLCAIRSLIISAEGFYAIVRKSMKLRQQLVTWDSRKGKFSSKLKSFDGINEKLQITGSQNIILQYGRKLTE